MIAPATVSPHLCRVAFGEPSGVEPQRIFETDPDVPAHRRGHRRDRHLVALCAGAEQDSDSVTSTLESSASGVETVRPAYLVGADGARSKVFELVGAKDAGAISDVDAIARIKRATGIDLPYEIISTDLWVASELLADR